MIRHVVLFTWKPGTTAEQIAAVEAGLHRLRAAIPEIQDYRFGADVGINEGNHDFAVAADFASVDDYLVYRDHPVHQRLIAELIRPLLAGRAAVQYAVD